MQSEQEKKKKKKREEERGERAIFYRCFFFKFAKKKVKGLREKVSFITNNDGPVSAGQTERKGRRRENLCPVQTESAFIAKCILAAHTSWKNYLLCRR